MVMGFPKVKNRELPVKKSICFQIRRAARKEPKDNAKGGDNKQPRQALVRQHVYAFLRDFRNFIGNAVTPCDNNEQANIKSPA
jgi:hypothetical protein